MSLSLDLCPVHVCIPVEVGNLDQLIGDGSKVSGLVFSAAVDTSLQFGSQGPQDTHTAGSLICRETECNKVPSKTFTSFGYIAVNIFYPSKSTVGMQWEMDGNM